MPPQHPEDGGNGRDDPGPSALPRCADARRDRRARSRVSRPRRLCRVCPASSVHQRRPRPAGRPTGVPFTPGAIARSGARSSAPASGLSPPSVSDGPACPACRASSPPPMPGPRSPISIPTTSCVSWSERRRREPPCAGRSVCPASRQRAGSSNRRSATPNRSQPRWTHPGRSLSR